MTGTSVVPFAEIENLTGSDLADSFLINGGSLNGVIDGGADNDTLTADNTFNLFQIDQVDGGELTWNRTNDAGIRVPAGVYFCKLEKTGGPAVRVVLMR